MKGTKVECCLCGDQFQIGTGKGKLFTGITNTRTTRHLCTSCCSEVVVIVMREQVLNCHCHPHQDREEKKRVTR